MSQDLASPPPSSIEIVQSSGRAVLTFRRVADHEATVELAAGVSVAVAAELFWECMHEQFQSMTTDAPDTEAHARYTVDLVTDASELREILRVTPVKRLAGPPDAYAVYEVGIGNIDWTPESRPFWAAVFRHPRCRLRASDLFRIVVGQSVRVELPYADFGFPTERVARALWDAAWTSYERTVVSGREAPEVGDTLYAVQTHAERPWAGDTVVIKGPFIPLLDNHRLGVWFDKDGVSWTTEALTFWQEIKAFFATAQRPDPATLIV